MVAKKSDLEVPTISFNGGTYTGGLLNEMPDGHGIWSGSTEEYVGDWKRGKREGFGVCKKSGAQNRIDLGKRADWEEGHSTYFGQWENDEFHGQGSYIFEEVVSDKSHWREEGLKQIKRVQYYAGQFSERFKDGSGTWFNTEITEYEDQPDEIFSEKYEGEWRRNAKHGKGTFTKYDGTKVSGEFKEDRLEGVCTWAYSSGTTFIGHPDEYLGLITFDHTRREGIWINPDGGKYEGQATTSPCGDGMMETLRDGQGTTTYTDGRSYKGEWKNDNEWEGTEYDQDGSAIAVFKEGVRRPALTILSGSK